MTIKADRWIRAMSENHGMIEPFVAEQVRGGIISYGLSSYGYDMRIADEFKVFTNVFNTLVDPKNFDNRSFVDMNGPHCDIPPNSFVLARSLEYFRIPRNVLSIVLGKSTYARCFSADTRVALVDGSSRTLRELADDWKSGIYHWGYSLGAHGRIIVTLLEAPRLIGEDRLLAITLDNGEVVHATPDHEFVLRDGRLARADELRVNTSLMPLYRTLTRGYEGVYQPVNGHYISTHHLADEWNLRHGIYEDTPQTHRHHLDRDRRNNYPTNLLRVPASEHLSYHNDEYYSGPDFDPVEHSTSIKEALQRLNMDPEWRRAYQAAQSTRAHAFWNDARYSEIREQLCALRHQYWKDETNRERQRERQHHYWASDERRQARGEFSRAVWGRDDGTRRAQQAEIARAARTRHEITADGVLEALHSTGSIRGATRLLECDRAVFRRFPELLNQFRGTTKRNHKVIAIEEMAGTHDVYCLSVPEAGNFALEAGVFVRNCGLIVNITPLEPAWEGFVTIEVSNTTPLPARIYANEGIAQVLFFESDEPCDVSYADKAGKYQGQVGVVPPRMK